MERRAGTPNSPDNFKHNAHLFQAPSDSLHNAHGVGTPKMPGEPPRVQPSKKVHEHWDDEGNRVQG